MTIDFPGRPPFAMHGHTVTEIAPRAMRSAWMDENARGLDLAATSAWDAAADAFDSSAAALSAHTDVAAHEATALVLNNLAQACFRAGRLDDGLRHAQRACALRAALAGDDAIVVARARADLAVMLGAVGRHAEARALIARAVASVERIGGDEDARLIPVLDTAARLALSAGEPSTAEPFLLRLHALLAAHELPTDPADVLLARVAQSRQVTFDVNVRVESCAFESALAVETDDALISHDVDVDSRSVVNEEYAEPDVAAARPELDEMYASESPPMDIAAAQAPEALVELTMTLDAELEAPSEQIFDLMEIDAPVAESFELALVPEPETDASPVWIVESEIEPDNAPMMFEHVDETAFPTTEFSVAPTNIEFEIVESMPLVPRPMSTLTTPGDALSASLDATTHVEPSVGFAMLDDAFELTEDPRAADRIDVFGGGSLELVDAPIPGHGVTQRAPGFVHSHHPSAPVPMPAPAPAPAPQQNGLGFTVEYGTTSLVGRDIADAIIPPPLSTHVPTPYIAMDLRLGHTPSPQPPEPPAAGAATAAATAAASVVASAAASTEAATNDTGSKQVADTASTSAPSSATPATLPPQSPTRATPTESSTDARSRPSGLTKLAGWFSSRHGS